MKNTLEAEKSSPLSEMTVLYVEDEPDIIEQISRFLRRRAGRVLSASNGREGLEMFLEHRPDIVITDLRMPEMNGMRMIESIKKVDEDIPVICATAHREIDLLSMAMDQGVKNYLVKPVDPYEMLRLLEEAAEKLQRRRNLENLALKDSLTGVWNRRACIEKLEGEIRRARLNSSSISLIFLDLDHFKELNDSRGHAAGDRVLCETCALFSVRLDSGDIFSRWGGEEFLIALPGRDRGSAAIFAEELRVALKKDRPGNIPVTASFGVAELRESETMDEWIERADRHLYAAKEAGRDRVITA